METQSLGAGRLARRSQRRSWDLLEDSEKQLDREIDKAVTAAGRTEEWRDYLSISDAELRRAGEVVGGHDSSLGVLIDELAEVIASSIAALHGSNGNGHVVVTHLPSLRRFCAIQLLAALEEGDDELWEAIGQMNETSAELLRGASAEQEAIEAEAARL